MSRPASVTAAFWLTISGAVIMALYQAILVVSGYLYLGIAIFMSIAAISSVAAIVCLATSVALLIAAFPMRRGSTRARVAVVVLHVAMVVTGLPSAQYPYAILWLALSVVAIVMLYTSSAKAYFGRV